MVLIYAIMQPVKCEKNLLENVLKRVINFIQA